MSALPQERIEMFNFTDLEEVEPSTASETITIAPQPNPRAELEAVLALPEQVRGLLMPIIDPVSVYGPKREPEECCPLCGAPKDWDD